MSPDDLWRVQHMIEAAEQALRFVLGRQRDDLDRDMRNRLVHAYFDIDLDILWDTVHLALPPLLAQLRPLLPHPTGT